MWKELKSLLSSDNLLTQAWEASWTMLDVDREMFLEAVRVLRESDDDSIDPAIRAKDKAVNQYERDVRRMVMTHCTLRGAGELPSALALISIVIDIERIGDYTKNIMDLAIAHPARLVLPEFEKELGQIDASIKTRFVQTTEVLREQDEEGARRLLETHKETITRSCEAIVTRLVGEEMASLSSADAAAAALYVRYLKRIGAHLKNVATSVVHPLEWIGYRQVREPE